jgi:hypothetical protein
MHHVVNLHQVSTVLGRVRDHGIGQWSSRPEPALRVELISATQQKISHNKSARTFHRQAFPLGWRSFRRNLHHNTATTTIHRTSHEQHTFVIYTTR